MEMHYAAAVVIDAAIGIDIGTGVAAPITIAIAVVRAAIATIPAIAAFGPGDCHKARR